MGHTSRPTEPIQIYRAEYNPAVETIDQYVERIKQPTLPNAITSVENGLYLWDKWCPDDGRIKIHFENIKKWWLADPEISWVDICISANGCRLAKEMAEKAFSDLGRAKDGKTWKVMSLEAIAFYVASAVHVLSVPIIANSENPEIHYKRCKEWMGNAFIAAMVIFKQDFEDDESTDERNDTAEV